MRILFTYKQILLPFVQQDIDILSSFGEVRVYKFPGIKKIAHLTAFLSQLWHLLTHKYDLYYCFFNDYHAVLPVWFARWHGKKSIVVIAGYDAVGVKNEFFTYGIFTSWWRTWCAKTVYRKAMFITSVSQGSLNKLKEHVPVDNRFSVIPFGWDIQENIKEKEDHVLIVGIANDKTGFYRKGYDRMTNLAKVLTEVKFICIGLNYTEVDLPSNVTAIGFTDHKEVLEMMSRAKVFIQPSRIEGMPNTLAEAMSSGCHIVASDVYGIPELCTHFIFPEAVWDQSIKLVAEKIQELISIPGPSYENSERIAKEFTTEIRKNHIKQLL